MKKILFLLLSTIAMYGQVPADATPLENIQITNNTTDNSATKVNVQSTDGTINTISKSDLVNVVEANDVPSLPLVGEVGKIYVVKNVNKIYRWNGTFYQELAGSDITYQSVIDALTFTPENVANKATALTASSTLYPTNNAVIVALATKEDKANKVTSIGSPANDTNYPSELAVKTYADNLVVGMLNDRGTWDASVNAFPTTGGSGVGGAIRKGDMWYISVAGILGTKSVNVGDSFRALVNTPAQVAANWSILEANIGYVPANDSNVVHLTGTETITGVKTFNDIRAVTNYKSSTNNVIISDTDGFVFRGVRSVAWSDNVNSRFFQVGDPNDNVAFTTRFGAAANRMLFSSLKTQISSGSFVSGIIPLGIFEVTNGTNRFFNVFESGNSVFGGSPDDLTNRLQVTGTVSSGTTALNNTPPTANNQLTRKDYVDSGLALKSPINNPTFTGSVVSSNYIVENQILSSSANRIKQSSFNDSWSIYGRMDTDDNLEMVFEVGDNGVPFNTPTIGGQRFRFHYDASTTGTSKDPFIVDYNTITINGLADISDSHNNLFAGKIAGNSTVTGSDNVGLGYASMNGISSGTGNTAIGQGSLQTVNIGSYNTAVGISALTLTTDGIYNTGIGTHALFETTSGNRNTAIGAGASQKMTTGSFNSSTGWYSLYGNTTGINNTAMGAYSLTNNVSGSGNVGLGYFSGLYETGSNSFYVNNQDRVNTTGDKSGSLIYGIFNSNPAYQSLRFNANTTVYGGSLVVRGVSGGNADFFIGTDDNTSVSAKITYGADGNLYIVPRAGYSTIFPTGGFNIGSLSGTGTRIVVADASGNLSAPNIPTAPTAPAGTNTTQIATTAFVQSNSRPYKVYTALLSQSGTSAPTAVVLENTLGGTVVWTRTAMGGYLGTLTGVFTANKTFCTTTIGAYLSGGSNSIGLVRNSVDDVFLFTNRGIAGTDAILNNASIEIRVYD